MKKTILLILTVLFVGETATALFAQDRGERRRDRGGDDRSSRFGGGPPGGGFGGPFGGGPPGGGFGGPFGGGPPMGGSFGRGGGPEGPGGSDSSRNERLIGMLKAMDANGDGKLEPSEIPEYRRPFVSMMISRLGGDSSKTVSIADLERKAAAGGGSDSSRRSGGSSSTAATPAGLPKDPLVPYFGEKEPELAAIVGFGQREPQPKVASSVSSSSGTPTSQSDQILRSAREIMNRYDKNKNGTLDKDKGEWVSSLPFNPDAADKNRDGRLSMTELVSALGGKAAGTMGSAVVSTKQSNAYDRLPIGVPDWFFERDKDQDGQLSMTEYANGLPWTEAIAEEFRFLDTNNDGFATVAEVFAALKKVDDDKRLKEEQAKRELERRQGGVAAVTPTTTTTTATPPTETPPPPPGTPQGPPGSPTLTPGTPPPHEAIPAEKSPDWKPPTTGPSEGKPIPTNAPYSSGSSDYGTKSRNKERKEYYRSGSYRSR